MSPDEVRARLASLREAGHALRRRPLRDTIDSLARVLDAWRDPESRWQSALADALPAATGFEAPTVREGLRAGLGPWSGDALRELACRELGPLDECPVEEPGGAPVAAVLLAGSIPMPSLLAVVGPLARGIPVLAKCASRDPVTPSLVARSISVADEALAACIDTVAFDGREEARMGALLTADWIVATGSDETVADVASRVRPPRRLVSSGHRLSLAVLGPEALETDSLERTAARIAYDTALWDQLGCLSPVSVHAVGAAPDAVDRLAEALAAALVDAEQRWPRGEVATAAHAAIAHERGAAEVRRAAGKRVAVLTPAGGACTIVREDDATPRPAPLHRFLRVHPVADLASLARALRPLGRHLAAVALAGFGAHRDAAADTLRTLGASRVCAPGELQSPPLDWRREGRDVLQPAASADHSTQ